MLGMNAGISGPAVCVYIYMQDPKSHSHLASPGNIWSWASRSFLSKDADGSEIARIYGSEVEFPGRNCKRWMKELYEIGDFGVGKS